MYNGTSDYINVQFFFTISGISGSCNVSGRYNCGSVFTYSSNGTQAWFYLTIAPSSYVSATMDHFVGGTGCCASSISFTFGTYETSPLVVGFCCDSNPGTGPNPGCDSSVTDNITATSCGADIDCASLIGTCVAVYCSFCTGTESAFYIVTSTYCDGGGYCAVNGDFSCCDT